MNTAIKWGTLILLCLGFNHLKSQTISWDDPVVVNDDISKGYTRPKITLDESGNAVIIWGKASNKEVYCTRIEDSQVTTPIRITPVGVNAFVQSWAGPGVSSFGNVVYATFKSQPESEGYVYVVKSEDGGKTFGDTIRVSNQNWSRFPDVTVSSDGEPVVAYMAFEPNFAEPHYVVAKYDISSSSFNDPVAASSVAPGEACDCCPAFVVTKNKVTTLLFRNNDKNLRDIWASVSEDNGLTFKQGKDVDQTNWVIGGCPSTGPNGTYKGDSLVYVWMSGASGQSKVFIGAMYPPTLELGTNIELTPDVDLSQNYPKVKGDSEVLVVTYQEFNQGKSNIKLVISEGPVKNLQNKQIVTVNKDETSIHQNPDIAYSSGEVHVVWQDSKNRKVMYRRGSVKNVSGILQSKKANEIKVFNTSESEIIISTQGIATGDFNIVVYNVLGSRVYEQHMVENQIIEINNLETGIYTVVLDDGLFQKVQRIVVSR